MLQAVALHRAGRLAEAEQAYKAILDVEPDNSDALHLLGLIAHQAGRHADAIALIGKALAINPAQPVFLNNLGEAKRAQDALDEAVACYRQALSLDPGYVVALDNLSAALALQGAYDEALSCTRRALDLNPQSPKSQVQLGNILSAQDKLDEAAAAYGRAAELQPNLAEAHFNLGRVRQLQGQWDEALDCYRRAVALQPRYAETINNLGNALADDGALEQAIVAYRAAFRVAPGYGQPMRHLSVLKRFRADDPDLRAIEEALAAPALDLGEAMHLRFALGKAYDDIGRSDEAFEQWRLANQAKRRSITFDATRAEAALDAIAQAFPAAPPGGADVGGDPSALPIFIVGMPRSGTTLVEQILASHPQVHGAGEQGALPHLARALGDPASGRPFVERVAALTPAERREMGAAYVAALRALAPEAQGITDKLPSNFRWIGLIASILPGARIVHCRRDPVATCLSCYKSLFHGELGFAYDLAELGAYYRAYDRLMAHWRRVLPGRMIEIGYEALVAEPEAEIRDLLAACDLPWDDTCLAFHRTQRPVRTASAAQVRQPIYRNATEHWHAYARHLAPLIAALGDLAPEKA